MKKRILLIMTSVVIMSALAVGCGGKTTSDMPDDSVITESESLAASAESVDDGGIAETTPEPQKLINTANAEGQIDESLPEYLQDKETPDVFVIEDPDNIYKEGYLIAPGTEVAESSSAVEGTVGTPVSVSTPKGTYNLTVTDYDLRDTESGQAITIHYSYQNMNISSDILVGSYGFALTGQDGTALSVSSVESDTAASPEPVSEGKTSGGTLSFIITGTPDRVTLYYNDTTKSEIQQFFWVLGLD